MIKWIFSKLSVNNKKEFFELFWQFVKFGIVGVSNTGISYLIYIVLVNMGVNYIVSNTIAFIVSVINAYFWNSKFVFKQANDTDTSKKTKAAIRLFMSYTATFLLGTVLLVLWVDVLEIHENIAPLINYCITIPLNFILNKFWSFGEGKK